MKQVPFSTLFNKIFLRSADFQTHSDHQRANSDDLPELLAHEEHIRVKYMRT